MKFLVKKYEKYGYAPVGLKTTLKFLVNRSIWKLLRIIKGDNPNSSWLKKPFDINDVFYSIINGYYFKASENNDINFMGGRHEDFQDNYINKILREGSIFIDVGAHLGRFTLLGANIVGNKGLVVALDPDQRVFQRLVENVNINNLHNVITLPIAASNKNFLAHFRLSKTLGWSSLTNMHENKIEAEVLIPAFTLDDLIESLELNHVELVKIDVEGAEDKVLEGAVNLLESFRPILLIEVHTEESWIQCNKILENKGYNYNLINRDFESAIPHFHIYAYTTRVQN